MYIELEELMGKLELAFGDLNNDCGCYVNHRDEYSEMAWLSIKAVKDLIDECEQYDEDDFILWAQTHYIGR